MSQLIQKLYFTLIIKKSIFVAFLLAITLLFLSQYTQNFRLDASSDSLVLENDSALKYFQRVVSKYGAGDILILTYSPNMDLFSPKSLDSLDELIDDLSALPAVQSVLSINNVPLTQSPALTLEELNGQAQLLRDAKTDIELAKQEFLTSPIYSKLLLSDDLRTAAIIITVKGDSKLSVLTEQRTVLREQKLLNGFTAEQQKQLDNVDLQWQEQTAARNARQDALVEEIRDISARYEDQAVLFLGGLPMIVSDSIRFIRSDVVKFGGAALLIILLILVLAFRQVVWVSAPLITCGVTAFVAVSALGVLNWPISVVSSNFISLLLIITLSLTIHLIVRFRELNVQKAVQEEVLVETIRSKFLPCVYTALTTMVAFASLIVSGIRPVIDFGWIMCLGIVIAVCICFTLFPILLSKFTVPAANKKKDLVCQKIIDSAEKAYLNPKLMSLVFAVLAIFSIYGIANLTVENRFIDYFKPSTEIYQGMYQIDSKLGGTTPLDIIIDAPASFVAEQQQKLERDAKQQDAIEDDFEDEFMDDFMDDFEVNHKDEPVNYITNSYWFNEKGINRLQAIHHDLDAMSATGKVLSLASSINLFEALKNAKPMDDLDLGFMYQVLSEKNKDTLFKPYLSEDGNQVHINIRVFESQPGLDREQLIQDIRNTLVNQHGIKPEQIHISGMLVLYNNMLNSLFDSQILTLGTVFLAILLMFMVLFRSVRLAWIAIVPNIFSALFVLGVMGVFRIPLDLMTITIAAISVGIAVDNSIHLVHRFKQELLRVDKNTAIQVASRNVGQAMIYTTVVIASGFLIMLFSNFVPTVYFGVLTALAVVTALFTNLTMLPILLAKYAKAN